jgi:phosphoribosylaminoimidazolecarboxamide formyltransferase/IMP cyclohydrolase
MNQIERRLALISVFDKTNLANFTNYLISLGFDIIASGGTAKTLIEAGVTVRDVADLVGGNAILGDKVKTLSREISAAILADYIKDLEEMEGLGLPFIDLLCVDLYPLQKELRNPDATKASVKEKKPMSEALICCMPRLKANALLSVV